MRVRSPLPTSDGRRAVVVVTASAVAGTLPVFLVGALAVQMRAELDFGPSQQGLLVSLFFGTVAVAALPLGQLADRLGWWQAIRTTAIGICVGLVVAALAQAWAMLAVALVGCALVHALGMPAGNLAIVRAVPASRRGLAFGIRQAAIPMSMLLGGLSVPLVAIWFGWRPVFVLALAVPMLVLVALRHLRASPSAGRAGHSDGARPPLTFPLVLMLGLSACGAFLVNTASAFLVSTAVEDGVDEGAAGVLLMLGSVVALAVRVVSGMVVDRRGLRGYGLIAGLLFAGSLGFVLVAAGNTAALVVGTAMAFGFGTGWPGLMHYVITAEHPQHAGGVSGWVLACGNIGGFIGPVLFGIVVEQWSYGTGWILLGVTAGLAGVLVLAAGREFDRRRALSVSHHPAESLRT